ncbi:MAG: hypothetical protein G8D61_11555 [gamma proteobacterium symbiont of Ctena orbiculata]
MKKKFANVWQAFLIASLSLLRIDQNEHPQIGQQQNEKEPLHSNPLTILINTYMMAIW